MARLFMYVVDRDFGFAPNPFHSHCTLATCKPVLRKSAKIGDWVVGMGGSKLRAVGRCIFAMQVSQKIGFQEYWDGPDFRIKRPARNGSKVRLVGDNVYSRDGGIGEWRQADSHHSHRDGSTNFENLKNDTSADAVLISEKFIYFGNQAPHVPEELLHGIGYKNGRGYRAFDLESAGASIVNWLLTSFGSQFGRVLGDPFNFDKSSDRYDVGTNKVIT